jgi:uncharacterized membrane protein
LEFEAALMVSGIELHEQVIRERRTPRPWQRRASLVSALFLSALFLVSGLWKLLDLPSATERMIQSLIPVPLALAAAIGVGAAETFAGILLLLPRFRRWGAWIAAAMLAAFIVYIGVLYDRLVGDECNCFPWIQRVVGPIFFIGDAVMLALAVMAGLWSQSPRGYRAAAWILAGVTAFSLSSYAVSEHRRSQSAAPASIAVDGKPLALRHGRVLLYFFDPECSHCYMVAKRMAKQKWLNNARVIGVPTAQPQFARGFLDDAQLRAGISPDAAVLRRAFPFTDPPYGVALHNGRIAGRYNSGQLEADAFYASLRELGFIE